MSNTFTCRLIKIMTSSHCMQKEELLTFVESFFFLLSCDGYVDVCTDVSAATVHCQPSFFLYDQEHRIWNCVVCWAIVTCLDIAGNSLCSVICLCFCVSSMNSIVAQNMKETYMVRTWKTAPCRVHKAYSCITDCHWYYVEDSSHFYH